MVDVVSLVVVVEMDDDDVVPSVVDVLVELIEDELVELVVVVLSTTTQPIGRSWPCLLEIRLEISRSLVISSAGKMKSLFFGAMVSPVLGGFLTWKAKRSGS